MPPDVLAPHAEQLVTFTTRHLLAAYLSGPSGARRNGRAAPDAEGEGEATVLRPGYEVAAKCGALKALAKVLTPENEKDEVRWRQRAPLLVSMSMALGAWRRQWACFVC